MVLGAGQTTADGKRLGPRPEEAGGQVVLEYGEEIAFRVTSWHTAPIYVYLLDFDVRLIG